MRLTTRGLVLIGLFIVAATIGISLLFGALYGGPVTNHVYSPQQLCARDHGTWQVFTRSCKLN